MLPEPSEDEVVLEYSAYPKSVQPGIPKLGQLREGWSRLPIGALLEPVVRPLKMKDDVEYQLVTARRNRGGIVARERSLGRNIATKAQFTTSEGDFLISRRQISHGACGIVPTELDGALVSGEYNTLLPTTLLNSSFLRHLTHSVYFQQTCFHSSIGVHVEKLIFRLDHWLQWPFDVPGLAEQQRIAAVLNTWDEATATTERLVETLIHRRRALSRQAFSASSPAVALGELGRFEKGRGLAKADVAEIGVPCLRYAEIYTRYGDTARQLASRASPAGVRSSRRLLSGEIVFAASGETAEEIGKAVAYLGDEPAVVGGDTVILTGHNQNAAYLAYALNSPSVVRQKSAAGKGHSVVHIHAADLAKVEIPLPPRDTQDQVAAVFRQADDEIEGRQVAADLLRRQKRGLMQKLLTGQWRVPATGDAFAPGGPAADRLEAAE